MLLAMAQLGDEHVGAVAEADALERGARGIAQRLLLARIGKEPE